MDLLRERVPECSHHSQEGLVPCIYLPDLGHKNGAELPFISGQAQSRGSTNSDMHLIA